MTDNITKKTEPNVSKRVLIVLATTQGSGGISNYFKILDLNRFENISYFTFYNNNKKLLQRLLLPYTYIKYFLACRNFDLVHLNTSMNQRSFYRDSIIAFITRLTNKSLLTFWHGWDEAFETRIRNNRCLSFLFNNTFDHSVGYIVLSNMFEEKLKTLSQKRKHFTYTTPPVETNDKLSTLIQKKLKTPIQTINILFLSRIEEKKGIYIVLESLMQLQTQGYSNVSLTIAGIGDELEKAKSFVRDKKIKHVTFSGFVSGEEKQSILMNSDVLFFPTYYPEGLPTTILESMYFGLLIITRPVAGIPEHIENRTHGYITDSLDSVDYNSILIKICDDKAQIRDIGQSNHHMAAEKYSAKRITEVLLKAYTHV